MPASADTSRADTSRADTSDAGSIIPASARSRRYVARTTLRGFIRDECLDLAAALTYYAVLAVFPAAIALSAVLGVVDKSTEAIQQLLSIVEKLGGGSLVEGIGPTLLDLSQARGAGLALGLGVAGALWSASGYVGAFGRAMNRIYGRPEGRPFWKLRLVNLALTAVLIVLVALTLLGLLLTGQVAQVVGDTLGLGSVTVLVWQVVKWPLLVLVVIATVALLYYATPNVRQPRLRWLSPGAALAIATWAVTSAGFGLYVSHFSSYDKTYGALGGVIAFLLWIWLTNLALLFGAELDAELERSRELRAGIPAEEEIQLPLRDTRRIQKMRRQDRQDRHQGRLLRLRRAPHQDRH